MTLWINVIASANSEEIDKTNLNSCREMEEDDWVNYGYYSNTENLSLEIHKWCSTIKNEEDE